MRPLVRFLYAYVLKRGFLDGRPGLYFCGLLAFYDFLALANRYEQQIAAAHQPVPVPVPGHRRAAMLTQVGRTTE
jgi:hypothetical protein